MEELKVGDRVQLVLPGLTFIADNRDYSGTLEEKTSTGWFIAWDDGFEDLIPDYKDHELQKLDP